MEDNVFGKRLKDLRMERGIGQVKLAKDIGSSKAIISLWENGMRTPGMDYIRLLCDYFDVPADYLIGRTNNY